MAGGGGGRYNLNPRSKSPILLIFLSLFAISVLFFLFSLSPNTRPDYYNNPHPTRSPETSFVASLEDFLAHRAPKPRSDDTFSATNNNDDVVKALDDSMYTIETERLVPGDSYYPFSTPIRVYVYEMPFKFTYDLLWLFRNTYKDTSNLTSNGSPVHRLIEQVPQFLIFFLKSCFDLFGCWENEKFWMQHSVDYWLWADLIAPESERLLKNVVRVNRQEEADLFYIPFFTTISFFLVEKQQCKALYRVWVLLQGFTLFIALHCS